MILAMTMMWLSSLGAQANEFCEDSYGFDNYGRGIEAGMESKSLQPNLADDVCYLYGVKLGKELHDSSNPRCREDFDAGYAEGRIAEIPHAGSFCRSSGYTAGFAALDIDVRESGAAEAGTECRVEYQRGYQAALDHVVPSPAGRGPLLDRCYSIGNTDGYVLEPILPHRS